MTVLVISRCVCVCVWDVGQLPLVPLLSVWVMRRAQQLVNFDTYTYFIKDMGREKLAGECVLLALSDLWLFCVKEIRRKARSSLLNLNYFWLCKGPTRKLSCLPSRSSSKGLRSRKASPPRWLSSFAITFRVIIYLFLIKLFLWFKCLFSKHEWK